MTSRTEYRADLLRHIGVPAALNAIISDVEHGIDRITRHQTSAATAAAAVTIEPNPAEEPVSFATELQHFLSVADEDMIRACNYLLAHPEGAQLISKAGQVAGFTLPAGTITSAVAGLDAVLGIIAPQQQPVAGESAPSFTPAGPQVAGQA